VPYLPYTGIHSKIVNPNEWQRKKWREAIGKELTKMENHKVWKVIKWNEIPKGRWCMKHKWVFEIKRNGASIPSKTCGLLADIAKFQELSLRSHICLL
jgi:hypothetical protein